MSLKTLRTVQKRTTDLVAEIDQVELAVRLTEAFANTPRPEKMTAYEILAITDPTIVDRSMKAAEVAMKYITEQINKGRRPS